jgi:hypothetical protein
MKNVAFLCIILFLVGCKPLSREVVDGQYIGTYGGAIETLTLNGDATYSQTLIKGGTLLYKNAGNWTFDTNEEKISLTDFIVAVDLSNAQLIKNSSLLSVKPDKLSYFHFSYRRSDGKSFLIGATKTLYYLEKAKTTDSQ